MTAARIATDAEKKILACRYVDFDDSALWTILTEYGADSTYDAFKIAVLALYPGATDERSYSLLDVDTVIGERLRLGIHTREELAAYHRQFFRVTQYLIGKDRYTANEQGRRFVQGLGADLWAKVSQRLQLKLPDHYPEDPYTLSALLEAANFVLGQTAIHSTTPTTSPPSAVQPPVKAEDLLSMIKEANTQMADVWMQKFLAMQGQVQPIRQPMQSMQPIQSMQPMRPQQQYSNAGPTNPLQTNSGRCNFCGEDTHFIARCPTAEQYMRDGKIRRDHENKVILLSGSYIPRTILGRWLKDRVDEWHRQNPNQLAAAHLSSNTSPTLFFGVTPVPTASVNVNATQSVPQISITPPTQITILKHDDTVLISEIAEDIDSQVASLEAQILALNHQKIRIAGDGVAKRMGTRKRPAIDGNALPVPTISSSTNNGKPTSAQAPDSTPPSAPATSATDSVPPPLHPFDKAKDAHYQPPKNKNFGSPPTKPKDPAYQTVAPIQNPKVAEDIFKRTLGASAVSISLEELLALSPDFRQKFRDATTPKRVQAAAANTNLVSDASDRFAYIEEVTDGNNAYVVHDTAETLYNMQDGDKVLRIAKDSHALRSIDMVVDKKEQVECIVDSGSMIIAMSDAVCHNLGLVYDPTVILHMESANGEVDASLGLARNVAFTVQDITFYFQVHVVKSPAYDVLLGRPFDILTASIIRNFVSEDQTITIRDPNTGETRTIPTYARGKPRFKLDKGKSTDFHHISRN